MDIPKDKTYPPDAGQCTDCGGQGCATCEQKGWLPNGHEKIRRCEFDECGKPLPPNCALVYCTNECTRADSRIAPPLRRPFF
jgi:hypothetical protein